MSTSENDIERRLSKDPIDRMIFEKNIRIKNVFPIKAEDRLIVFLNNGSTIMVLLSSFDRLKGATQEELDKWALISTGVGIEWDALDEDLSLKGLIQQVSTENAINLILNRGENTSSLAA